MILLLNWLAKSEIATVDFAATAVNYFHMWSDCVGRLQFVLVSLDCKYVVSGDRLCQLPCKRELLIHTVSCCGGCPSPFQSTGHLPHPLLFWQNQLGG